MDHHLHSDIMLFVEEEWGSIFSNTNKIRTAGPSLINYNSKHEAKDKQKR